MLPPGKFGGIALLPTPAWDALNLAMWSAAVQVYAATALPDVKSGSARPRHSFAYVRPRSFILSKLPGFVSLSLRFGSKKSKKVPSKAREE